MNKKFANTLCACIIVLISANFRLNAQNIDSKSLLKHIKILSADSMQGRLTGTEGAKKAREYIKQQYRDVKLIPYYPNYEQHFKLKMSVNGDKATVDGCNLIGKIDGDDRSKAIVISAHYDHVGIKSGKIYNGADDNASSVAVLIEIARYFKSNKPRHTLLFCSFDAEEQRLAGSKAFVKDIGGKNEKIVFTCNMDMISISSTKTLYAAGSYHYSFLKKLLDAPIKSAKAIHVRWGHDRPELKHNDWTLLSDHAPFHRAHIPFIYFGVEDHEHYHQPTDRFENIHQEFFIEVSQFILSAIIHIDKNLEMAR